MEYTLQTNLEDRQYYRLLILKGVSCGQKDLSIGIAHCKRLVLTVPGDTLGGWEKSGESISQADILRDAQVRWYHSHVFMLNI